MVTPITQGTVRGSRTGRPIMALLDLLGRRWTLRIIWELRETTLTSRALAHRLRRGVAHDSADAADRIAPSGLGRID